MAQTPKKAVGRPSKFDKRFIDEAHKLALLGATDEEMAEFWGVTVKTLFNWRAENPAFLQATTRGKIIADAEMAKSLWHRGMGYSHSAEKIFNGQDGIVRASYTEHYPPDTQAASLWLRNRQPTKWRDRQETTTQLVDGNNEPVSASELARHIAFLLASGMAVMQAQPDPPAPPEATKH